jgi:hypothetical protein
MAQDADEAVKLLEEVTRAQADAITVRARSARAEETVQEKVVLLEVARGKEVEAGLRASALWGELVAVHQERDAAEEKVSSQATEAVVANQQREVAEEQCGRLAQELTFLSIRGSELCITVTGSPLRAPLHEGVRFPTARHTKVASQFFAPQAAMSLVA